MAGRISYLGGIVRDGLVLDLDAAKTQSYPRTGTLWSDISGNQNNGTLINGPTFDSGNGGSIVFDGTSDKTEILSTQTVNFQSTITLEIMLYPTLSNQNGAVITKWTTGAGSNNSYAFTLGQDATNNRYGFYINQSNNTIRSLLPTTNFGSNMWNHIVCTADGSIMRTYKNSIIDTTTQTYDGTIKLTNKKLVIASLREEDNLYNYTGRVGFTRIYNRALTATEVLQNYNATRSRFGL
jgi:hypothetical protein